jgi:colanic acid/amylovoran biosynthesis protein
MFIEVSGIGFTNKGGELMLAAIVQRLAETRPDIGLVGSPKLGAYATRAKYGLLQTLEARRAGRLGFLIEALFREGYRRSYGMVHRNDIAGVVDASGFALGDQWPIASMVRRHADLQRRKARGQKIIFLPQAFGPFERPEVSELAKRILELPDLIYARDKISLGHVEKILPGLPSLRQAPDFTNLVKGTSDSHAVLGSRPAAIVPNQKIIEHNGGRSGRAYMKFLADMAASLRGFGLTPFILLHETDADRELAAELKSTAGLDCATEADPLVVKAIMGSCEIVISSRYHGLINALSQAVPAIGTSWSHKYEMLFEDYGKPQWLVDYRAGAAEATQLVAELLDDLKQVRSALSERSRQLKQQACSMWREVEALLGDNQVGEEVKLA